MTTLNQQQQQQDKDKILDPADVWMQRGAFLRQLRQMELLDQAERQRQQQEDATATATATSSSSGTNNDSIQPLLEDEYVTLTTATTTATATTRNGTTKTTTTWNSRMLLYESYLAHQRYYDDLKHADYRYIDYSGTFGRVAKTQQDQQQEYKLVMEQDKTLGKGGFCWDAAFVLGDYVIQQLQQQQQQQVLQSAAASLSSLAKHNDSPASKEQQQHLRVVVELGCGTGLAGMMVAKAIPNLHVYLTDLPAIMPLVNRNVQRNFDACWRIESSHHYDQVGDNHNDSKTTTNNNNNNMNDETDARLLGLGSASSPVAAHVLDWASVVQQDASSYSSSSCRTITTYDIILGADVVASLYDPIALAQTMYVLSHADTIIYLTFKERLSVVHRQFEQAINERFDECNIIFRQPAEACTRNRNPDIQIMQIQKPKTKANEKG